jgi:hypothetical protein
MKTRYLIILMIAGMIFITCGLLFFSVIIIDTPTLWGVRSPLIYLGLCGVACGIGVTVFGIGSWAAIDNTKDRIKKAIKKKKTLSVLEKAREL